MHRILFTVVVCGLLIAAMNGALALWLGSLDNQMVGYWEISANQIKDVRENKGEQYCEPHPFIYDGKHVLLEFKVKENESFEFLRLRSRVRGGRLEYLHTNNKWYELAKFDYRKGRFSVVDEGIAWEFQRNGVPKWAEKIPPHEYTK